MKDNAEQLHALLQSIGGIVWEASADMQHFYAVSDEVTAILGDEPDDWKGQSGIWARRVHPDDRWVISAYRQLGQSAGNVEVLNYRMLRKGGQVVWVRDTVSAMQKVDGMVILHGFMLDVSTGSRLQALEQLERHVLRLNSDLVVPITEVLITYLKGMEALFPQIHCSIHRIVHGRLDRGIAPSLADGYMQSMISLPIGENEGSCGSAAYLKKQVIVSDIAADHRWDKYRDIALAHGLRACWSEPVINSDGEVIATLSMYHLQARGPEPDELNVLEKASGLLRIILENRQKTEIIHETNLLMLQSQDLAHFGNWRWLVREDSVSWSPALYDIYGLDRNGFKATFAGYQELLHPEDRDYAYKKISGVLQTGEDASFEERIIRPDGEIRYLRSWAKLKKDGQGEALELIGACLDITESVLQRKAIEQQNQQLLEIAWVQSHVVRAPLSRIMTLTELLRNIPADDADRDLLIEYLEQSARELDKEIQLISQKAEIPEDH